MQVHISRNNMKIYKVVIKIVVTFTADIMRYYKKTEKVC